jgi:hypothetical protein
MSDQEWDVLDDFGTILAVRYINPSINRRQQLILLIGP